MKGEVIDRPAQQSEDHGGFEQDLVFAVDGEGEGGGGQDGQPEQPPRAIHHQGDGGLHGDEADGQRGGEPVIQAKEVSGKAQNVGHRAGEAA